MSSIGNIQQSQNFDSKLYDDLIQRAEAGGVSASEVDAKLLAALSDGKDFMQAHGQVWAELPKLPPPTSTAPNSTLLQQLGTLPPAATLGENLDRDQLVLGVVNGTVEVAASREDISSAKGRPHGLEGLLDGLESRLHGPANAEILRTDEEKIRDLFGDIQGQVGKQSSTASGGKVPEGSISTAGVETLQTDEERIRDLFEGIQGQLGKVSQTVDKTLSGADAVQQNTDNRVILG
jgi:hypothetical protein